MTAIWIIFVDGVYLIATSWRFVWQSDEMVKTDCVRWKDEQTKKSKQGWNISQTGDPNCTETRKLFRLLRDPNRRRVASSNESRRVSRVAGRVVEQLMGDWGTEIRFPWEGYFKVDSVPENVEWEMLECQ